jgi:hypothetical protein
MEEQIRAKEFHQKRQMLLGSLERRNARLIPSTMTLLHVMPSNARASTTVAEQKDRLQAVSQSRDNVGSCFIRRNERQPSCDRQ